MKDKKNFIMKLFERFPIAMPLFLGSVIALIMPIGFFKGIFGLISFSCMVWIILRIFEY